MSPSKYASGGNAPDDAADPPIGDHDTILRPVSPSPAAGLPVTNETAAGATATVS